MRTKTFKPLRIIVTIRNWDGAMRAAPRTPRSCDGPRGSLSMRPLGLAGQHALQARLARLCRSHRSPRIDRRTAGVSPHHHTMTFTDVGGRVTDGAGSPVAAEWTDRARTVTLRSLTGWCSCVYKPGWLWPLRMAKRASKRATRGGERQSTEAPAGHRIRAPRPERSVRSVWTRRACLPPALNRSKAQHACVLRPTERGEAGCQLKTPMTGTPSSTWAAGSICSIFREAGRYSAYNSAPT